MGPELGLKDDVRLMTVAELRDLREQNKNALRSVSIGRNSERKEYFKKLYQARLQLIEGEIRRRSA